MIKRFLLLQVSQNLWEEKKIKIGTKFMTFYQYDEKPIMTIKYSPPCVKIGSSLIKIDWLLKVRARLCYKQTLC